MWKEVLGVLGMLLTVVFILALAYLCTKYFSRWKLGNMSKDTKSGHMKTLDQLTVGADLRLILVQVGTRYLLLGLSSSGIQPLAELSAEEASLWEEDRRSDAPQLGTTTPSFREAFMDSLKQKRK